MSETPSVIEVPSWFVSQCQSERPREFGQSRHQVFIFGQDLHSHVIGTGVHVLFQSRRDGLRPRLGLRAVQASSVAATYRCASAIPGLV
jgi:hypothetical protein